MKDDAYYRPPTEWTFREIRHKYQRLASTYRVETQLSLEHSCESELAKVKCALQDISRGIKTQDSAAIEVAIEFVLSDVFFHYSGHIRATMARRLKSAGLSEAANERLRRGLLKLFSSGTFGPEHKEFARLLRNIGLSSMEEEYKKLFHGGSKQQMVAKELFNDHSTMPSTGRATTAYR